MTNNQDREFWLSEYGRTEEDVFVENGREWIAIEEDEHVRRIELPERFQGSDDQARREEQYLDDSRGVWGPRE